MCGAGNDVVIEALKSLVRQEERQLGEERSEGGSLQEEASLENSKRPDGKGMPQDQEARNDCGSALSVGTCGQADVIILAQVNGQPHSGLHFVSLPRPSGCSETLAPKHLQALQEHWHPGAFKEEGDHGPTCAPS